MSGAARRILVVDHDPRCAGARLPGCELEVSGAVSLLRIGAPRGGPPD